VTTLANAPDVTKAHELLHGQEKVAYGDAGYRRVEKRDGQKNVAARRHVALRPGKRRALPNNRQGRIAEQLERLKASVRAKVEHPFHMIKNRSGLMEGSLPQSVQEHRAAVHDVCDGESADGQGAVDGASRSRCVLSCPRVMKGGPRSAWTRGKSQSKRQTIALLRLAV